MVKVVRQKQGIGTCEVTGKSRNKYRGRNNGCGNRKDKNKCVKTRAHKTGWRKFVAFICVGLFIVMAFTHPAATKIASQISPADVLIIDAGHGGFDGGAESAKGVSEKDINLAIAQNLQRLAETDGWKVIMTREKDCSLEGDARGSIRSKKTADLKARKTIIDDEEPNLTISIHLNSFKQDRSVRGAQVFYPAGGDESNAEDPAIKSKLIAETVQKQLIADIADGTERVALPKGDARIMKNAKTPIILVECGFLSNAEEAELLQDDKYQQKLAEAIYAGTLSALGKKIENKEQIKVVESENKQG